MRYFILSFFFLITACTQNQENVPFTSSAKSTQWEQSNIQEIQTDSQQAFYKAPWVKQAEEQLVRLKYLKQADTIYDQTTLNAVRKFQADHQLKVNGWVDNATFQKLQPSAKTTSTSALTSEEQEVVRLTNEQRAQQGLPPLRPNAQLAYQAKLKAQDMIKNNYFSHISPTLGNPFDQMRNAGITFLSAGENLAGNQTAFAAVQSWMNSSGHRANILNIDFNEIGVGVAEGGPYGKMYVQMFMKR